MRPVGSLECEPVMISLEAELKEPLGLFFLLRDETYHLFVETLGDGLRMDVGHEAILVVPLGDIVKDILSRRSHRTRLCVNRRGDRLLRIIFVIHLIVALIVYPAKRSSRPAQPMVSSHGLGRIV